MTPTGPGTDPHTSPPGVPGPVEAAAPLPQAAPRLRELLREDLSRYVWSPSRRDTVLGALEPGFQAVAVHRYAAWTRTQTGVRRKLARWCYDLACRRCRTSARCGASWPPRPGRGPERMR